MRDHSKHIQLTREDATAGMLARCEFHPAHETVPVGESFGRVLAEDALSQVTLPNCLTCRMDSIAVHWDDFADGIPDVSGWQRGVQWEFGNTGVGMPEGFDTAIVVEHVVLDKDNNLVSIDTAPSEKFAGTTPVGSRMHEGDVLVKAGVRITPLLAAHIASGNNTTVEVVARPKVAFIPTGDELVKVGSDIPRGCNIDSNSILMKGKIEHYGGEPLLYDIVPDNPEAIERALRDACLKADIVVINAGSSKGSSDWTLELIERIGEVLNHQTNHGPGHHSSYSVVDGVPVVGISGPPGGAAFTADFYLKPLVDKFLGLDPTPVRVHARVAEPLEIKKPGAKASGNDAGKKAPVIHGEDRPLERGTNGVFNFIRQVYISVDDQGCLQVTPTKSPHPSAVDAEGTRGYVPVPSGEDVTAPQVGDIIEVELKP